MSPQDNRLDTPPIDPTSLVVQSGALLLGRGAALLFSFVTPLILVRVLDQSVFGEYKQYFLIGVTAAQMAALGLPWSLYFFVPGGGDRRGEWVGTTILVLVVVGLGVVIAGLVLGPTVAERLNSPALGRVVPHLAIYAALMLVTQFAEDLAVIEQRPRTAATVVFLGELLRTGMIVIAVLGWGTLTAIAWASLIYAGSRSVFVLAYSFKLYGSSMYTVRWANLKRLLTYAIPFGVAVPLEAGQIYLHQYFVAAVTDPATFALYAVGCFQIPLVHVVYTAVADVALVRAAALSKVGDKIETRQVFTTVLRILGVFFVPLYLFAATFAPSIIEVLFTTQYLAAAPIFVVFSLMVFGQSVDHVVLRAHAQTRFMLAANAAGLLISGALLVPLYSSFGLAGAALSYVVGLLAVRVIGLLKVRRLLAVSMLELLPVAALLRTGACAGAAGLVAFLASQSLEPIARLLLGAMLFTVVYGVLAWRSGILTDQEKTLALKHMRRVLRRADVSR